MQTEKQRLLIVVLLLLSCITAIVLLWKVEPVTSQRLQSPAQIDSLITLTFDKFEIPRSQVRTQTIEVDSVFSRKVYNIRVAPNFSKTTLHYTLHETLWPFGIETAARVEFPERDMHIYMLVNNNIHRTMVIKEDRELQLQRSQPIILPGQNSHEVD